MDEEIIFYTQFCLIFDSSLFVDARFYWFCIFPSHFSFIPPPSPNPQSLIHTASTRSSRHSGEGGGISNGGGGVYGVQQQLDQEGGVS
jgi:hypothetical protein